MFKIVKGENSDLIVLDEPIRIPNSENTIEFFELEKLNSENEYTIGTFNFYRNLSIDAEVNIEEYEVLRQILNNEYITLKYKILYENEELNLKIILEYYRLDELYKTEEIIQEIDLNIFMDDIISSIKTNNSFFINNNESIYKCIENLKKDLFLNFLKEDMYIEVDNELFNNVEIYQYINGEKKIFAISNRIIIDYERSIICLCEAIKYNKFNNSDICFNIRIDIDNEKELLFKNIKLVDRTDKDISYMMFNLKSFKNFYDNIFIKSIKDEYIKIKVNDLDYLSYKQYDESNININNDEYDEYDAGYDTNYLIKFSDYLYNNNSESIIKKYIKINKIKSINNINLDNYLLYKELFS